MVKNLPPSTRVARDADLIPGSGRSPGLKHSNLLQYCCLGNLMDRGAGGLQSMGPWGYKETNMTEHTYLEKQLYIYIYIYIYIIYTHTHTHNLSTKE